MAVEPLHRRKGIGGTLLRAAMVQAREEGYRTLSLSVAVHNRSRMMYQRVGLREGRRARRQLDDAGQPVVSRAVGGGPVRRGWRPGASSAAYSARTFVQRRRTIDQRPPTTHSPAIAHENGCSARSTLSQRSPSGIAEPGQGERPRQASQHRVEGEAPEGHPDHPGRQRDEGADHREEPGEEDRRIPVALEPVVGLVDLVRADQQVAPEPVDQRTSAVGAGPVRQPRTDQVAERARHAHPEQRELLPRSREPGAMPALRRTAS